MRAPLTVRIADGVRDQHVTRFVKGLRFTKTAPGGHHSASVQLEVPDDVLGGLGPADRIYIYDGRNASTVWDGYVENPGRAAVLGGGRYDLSAMGGVVLASDNAQAVVFRSTDLSGAQWTRATNLESAQAGLDGGGIKLQFQPGSAVDSTSSIGMLNKILESTNQPLGAVYATWTGGQTGGAWVTLGFRNLDGSYQGSTPATADALGTGTYDLVGTPAHFSFGDTAVFSVDLAHNGGATTITADTVWVRFPQIVVAPGLKTKTGTFVGGTPTSEVYAHEVVAHVLGDMLPLVDGASSLVETTTFPIDNLAYTSGAKPHQILDDLSLFEPDLLWEILESNQLGKHRFAYRKWPTTPRYEISGRDFTESGGEVDLCNRIVVTWADETGAEQAVTVLTDVPDLGSRVRDAEPIALPDGMGSLANAVQIGTEVLAALNTPTRSGTAVVRERVYDRLRGMMVMPWEIEPGYLVRVRDIGVDLRLTEMTYEDENCTSSLTLGTPTLTLPQRLARLRSNRAA